MKTFLIYAVLPGLLLLCCVSCRTVEPPKPTLQPASFEESVPKLAARSDHWRGYQAKLRIRASGTKGKMRFQAIVLANLPDQLRLEAFSLVGQTVALFTMNNAKPVLWIPSEKMMFTAERPETLIDYFFGIPLPAGVFAYNLAAVVPPGQLDRLRTRQDSSGWVAETAAEGTGASWRWEFTAQPPALRAVAIKDGPWECRITYDPGVGLELRDVPQKMRLESAQWQMDVAVEQIVPASGFEASAFAPPVQSGIRTVDLDSIK